MAVGNHTAPGQMAGYLFQPDRALVILCGCNTKEFVSIELVDDLAIADANGNVFYREQAKNTIQNSQTFGNRSKDLWNTLDIWCTATKAGELDIEKTKLICVTNTELKEDLLVNKLAQANSEDEIQIAITLLKSASASPPEFIQEHVLRVMSDEPILRRVVRQLQVIGGNDLEKRNEEIAEKLHLSDQIKDNVIESLRGWLNENILQQLESGKAPVISKKDFNEKLNKLVTRETDDRIMVLAKAIVKGQITKAKVDEAGYRNFVRQLDLINHQDKHNIILDAIDDFLCSETERTRLTLKGDLTRQELQFIDDNSKDRWKDIFRRKIKELKPDMTDADLGDLAFEIFASTIENYLSKIRGFDTEPYFTKGSFHKLAEELEIGWHPNWQKHFPKK